MSVLINLSIFPMDKGKSVSPYVSRVVKIFQDSGLSYKFGPMATSIEGTWNEVMGVASQCFEELKKDCDRVYMVMNVDYRKGPPGRTDRE